MTHKLLTFSAAAALAAGLSLTPAAASAQDHLVIPLSHPSQPATVKVSALFGSITVKAYDGRDVIVDGAASARLNGKPTRQPPPEADGMHLLSTTPGLDAKEEDNQVSISENGVFGSSDLTIQVPAHTSLSLHATNGRGLEVDGVTGDISVESTNGGITLKNVGGSIVAHALNGRIEATLNSLDTSKPSSFSSMNGTIDVTLPADIHTTLSMKSDMGNIYMDDGFNFTQTNSSSNSSSTSVRGDNGMYHVRTDRGITGTLNGGGAEIHFQNFNGNIYIRKAH